MALREGVAAACGGAGLRGDRVMAGRNEPTPMSTAERVSAIVSMSKSSA